ncbi:MAG: DMT family transporter [Rhodobacteraceae bacterium]|nr:DMT family transporter [Paracoccaceae bacterium]MBR9822226.1 DMT family transporter [Paracoccaceae bacterium]
MTTRVRKTGGAGAPQRLANRATLAGVALVLLYTALISSADAITKFISGSFAAPQLYVLSGALVASFCLGAEWLKSGSEGVMDAIRTSRPVEMGVRSCATVIASVCYFYAFKLLEFAEVFVFIGLMPIFAGLMSGPLLKEKVSLAVWFALGAGFIGIVCLFPEGVHAVSLGHLIAFGATASGTLSMVMARRIGQHERNALAQVFWPNATLALVMAVALPFVFRPMGLHDLFWIAAYAGFLFFARWVLVVALRLLAAYVVTPLMNLQFVWMVIMGALIFGETTQANVFLGSAIVIGSGLYLIYDQLARGGIVRAGGYKTLAAEEEASDRAAPAE